MACGPRFAFLHVAFCTLHSAFCLQQFFARTPCAPHPSSLTHSCSIRSTLKTSESLKNPSGSGGKGLDARTARMAAWSK